MTDSFPVGVIMDVTGYIMAVWLLWDVQYVTTSKPPRGRSFFLVFFWLLAFAVFSALFSLPSGWQHTEGDWHQPPCEGGMWESRSFPVPAAQSAGTRLLRKGDQCRLDSLRCCQCLRLLGILLFTSGERCHMLYIQPGCDHTVPILCHKYSIRINHRCFNPYFNERDQ